MNKLYKISLILSSIFSWYTLHGYNSQKLILFITCGFFTGVIAYILPCLNFKTSKTAIKIIEISLLIISSVIICYLSANYLYNIILNPTDASFFIHNQQYTNIFNKPLYKYILTLLQIPFVYFVVKNIYIVSSYAIHSLNIKKMVSIIKISIKPQKIFISLITTLLLLFTAVIIGTSALILAFSIPTKNIETNIYESAKIIYSYKEIHPVLYKWCNSRLDNYTDSLIMLESAYNGDNKSIIKRALIIYRNVAKDNNPAISLINHYFYLIPFDSIDIYTRYWNGQLIISKPLFNFFSYNKIRTINGFIQVITLLLIVLLLIKKNLKQYVIPYTIVYFMLMPIMLMLNFHFSCCYYIFSFGTILLLLMKEKILKSSSMYIFLLLGILTAYFDFLTYPLSTYGIPILIYLIIINKYCIEEKLYFIFRNFIYWIIGYSGMWISKWIMAYLIANYDYSDAINQLILRTTKYNLYQHYHYIVNTFDGIISQFELFFFTPISIFAFIFILYNIYLIKKNKCNINKIEICKLIFPYIIIAILPILWYSCTTNHSIVHAYYANKALSITLIAMLFAIKNVYTDIINTKQKDRH